MLIRSLAGIFIVALSFVLAAGQAPNSKKEEPGKPAATPARAPVAPLRNAPFPGGVDLQYLIKDLAMDMDLNVLFDPESRLDGRKLKIDLRGVTSAEAIKYILVQERLYSEEVGPRTILVSSQLRGNSVPQIGVGVTPLTAQLAQYFGVTWGILINEVRPNSPGAKAGLRAGDVIVGIDDEPVRGALGLVRAIDEKKQNDITLRVVRDRKDYTVTLRF